MNTHILPLRILVLLAGIAMLAFSGWAVADPPSRVARLAYIAGAVSLSPAGDNGWFEATVNRPLTTGDRLWVDSGARAELQTGGALIRMKGGTGVSILNLDDGTTQLQLTQGTLNVRVRRLAPGEVFEVDTPNLAFTLRKPGAYRIEVEPDNDATTIFVRKGQGEVYGEDAAYVIDSRQPYRFTGTGLREYEYVDVPRPDDFDRWSSSRDRRYDDSRSVRYVSEDVVGYQELDEYGDWRDDPTYGSVWYPNRVATGWAPYRDGHWAWIDPWGWTWVDDAPWGFAVSHYGRWAYLRGTWGWVPGPVRNRAWYAPALVVFVGGGNFQLTVSSGPVGGVAWFPLAPREVYRPVYKVSRGYFENINRSNTVINTTVINNYYNNTNVTNEVYANRAVEGAVVAVPTTAFAQSQPVSRSAVRVSREVVGSAPLALVAPVAPTEKSVRGAAGQGESPPARAFERGVVARTAPPAAPVGFAAQQQQLTAGQGKPLDEAERKALKREATAPAPAVKVVAPKQEAPPTVQPPPAAPAAQPRGVRGRPERRGDDEPRGTPDERGNDAQRGQTAAPRPSPRAVESEPAPPRATPAVPAIPATRTRPAESAVPPTPVEPAARMPEPRGKSEQREEREQRRERPQREQAITPPPALPRGVPQPEAAPPRAIPEVPAVQSREPRDRSERRGNGAQRERDSAVPPPPAQQPAQRARPEPAPAAEPRGEEPRPAAGRGRNKNKDGEAQKQEDERR